MITIKRGVDSIPMTWDFAFAPLNVPLEVVSTSDQSLHAGDIVIVVAELTGTRYLLLLDDRRYRVHIPIHTLIHLRFPQQPVQVIISNDPVDSTE